MEHKYFSIFGDTGKLTVHKFFVIPTFEIYSNPVTRLSDIKVRRFDINIKQTYFQHDAFKINITGKLYKYKKYINIIEDNVRAKIMTAEDEEIFNKFNW